MIIKDYTHLFGNNVLQKKVGILDYILSIFQGINKSISSMSTYDDEGESIDVYGNDAIITLSKRGVIITELINNRRVPICVKKVVSVIKRKGYTIFYDNEGFKWMFVKDNHNVGLEYISVSNSKGDKLFFYIK